MIRELYEKISSKTEVRANLIALKKAIRDENEKRALAYLLAGDYAELAGLLKHEDAKVRKNAALILGEMECEDMLPELWKAYQKEQQLFVRPSYLKAMAAYDCRIYLPELKKRKELLMSRPAAETDAKHVKEELAELRGLLLKYEKERRHVFTELSRETDVILLTNREHREVTREQLPEEKTVLLAGGIRIHTRDVQKLFQIRTWTEMLFPVPGTAVLPEDPREAGERLAKSGLLPFLGSCHRGEGPFYFRAEIRGRMDRDEKSSFVRKLAAGLEAASSMELINSASDYEIELRLLQKKDGGFIPLLKLYTWKDGRFAYRKNVLASSIHPANAALLMRLLKPYLKEHAQVLDPFCGVGTMLVERQRLMAANPLYGIDIYPEAIEKARENAEAAKVRINFINRDFLDFRHEYLFDEIITNMPGVTRTKGVEEITELYERFFRKVPEVLKKDGLLAVYTTEEGILLHCLRQCDFLKVEKRWTVREKEGSVLYALRCV